MQVIGVFNKASARSQICRETDDHLDGLHASQLLKDTETCMTGSTPLNAEHLFEDHLTTSMDVHVSLIQGLSACTGDEMHL